MKTKLLAAAAFAVAGLTATSALASNTITQNGESVTITAIDTPWTSTLTGGPGFVMIDDFDGINPASGFTVAGGQIFTGSVSGVAAAPPTDGSHFEAVQVGNPFTITDTHGFLTDISFYMGSPDGTTDGTGSPQNNLTVTVNGALGPIVLHGPDIWGGPGVESGDGNQNVGGFLITYHFTPNSVHSLTFTQTGAPAFEFDNLAGISVPEPASWALMIMGFGAAGAMLRGKRRDAATA
jgi:hypothetical protein